MNDPKLVALFGSVVALLAIASLVSRVIRRGRAATPTLVNLTQRVNAWWVMVGVFACSMAVGRTGVFVLYALLSFLALREFVTLTPTPRGDHRTLAWIFYLILPIHYLLAWAPWYAMYLIFIPVYGFVLIPVRSALAGDTGQFLERTAKLQWGVLVCVYFLSYVPMLLYLPVPGAGNPNARLLFFMVLVTQMSDVLQYVFGKLFGRRALVPSVSPGKTVEGFVYGGLAATAVGTALWWATPFTPGVAAAMSLLLVLAGFLGGLVMSAVKRSMGAKDWGKGIPGHGGVLDRLDSLLFAAPLFFHLTGYHLGTSMAKAYPQPGWIRTLLSPLGG
jgi:phosphatidate cytidylyltransferase